ncbi:MAG: ATP-binding protein [Planctomycetota bacterium]
MTSTRPDHQRFRWLASRLPAPNGRHLALLTGARQTGKTSLARGSYPALRYLDLDDLEVQTELRGVRPSSWGALVGVAVLDEAQKEPSVLDKVLFALEGKECDFSVLLASSRSLQKDETLSRNASRYELWPLMPSELRHAPEDSPSVPLLDSLFDCREPIDSVLEHHPEILIGKEDAQRRHAISHLATWGGMPELLWLDDEERRRWLREYQRDYVERDLADLARLTDLQPFLSLMKFCMLRSGQMLSFSKLARDAAIGTTTARRYLDYLKLSYQLVLLPPFTRSLTSSVVKSPKIYWVDLGLLRQGTRQWGDLTGEQFETLVIAEVHKWVSTMARQVKLYFYRTRSGLEVDLLVETRHGMLGFEIKKRERVFSSDAKGLRAVAQRIGETWLGGGIIYRGDRVFPVSPTASIWALPVHCLF